MSTPTPSTSASEPAKRESPSADSPELSPRSPDDAAKLEALSSVATDQAALPPASPPRAGDSPGKGKEGLGKKQKSSRWAIWTIGFLAFAAIASVLGLAYIAAGSISGTEFDAVNWTTREFQFVRDPFTEAQLTNVKHSGNRFTLDPAIATYIAGGSARPVHPRWDLVQIYRGMSPDRGEAHILLDYLQAADRKGNNYWVQWTSDHSKAAPILWGAVRDAVHLERYDRLPEIFDRVRVDDDPNALQEALAKIMLKLALEEARSRAEAGDQAGARRAALVGLSYGQSDELSRLAGQQDDSTQKHDPSQAE